MNKCILSGNLSKEPEFQTTTNGVAVCKFSLAVPRQFKSSDGERETDFLNIVTWRGLAENCNKYLKKGSKAGVCGSIQTRSYKSNDGSTKYITEIIAEEVEFYSISKQTDNTTNKKEEQVKFEPVDDGNLPF